MINFETKTFVKNQKTLIKNGKAVNGYTISDKQITLSDIESLYQDYEASFPDKQVTSMFPAKPESELKLSEIIYNKNRSDAQEILEQTLLEGILNKSLIYPDDSKWFWQSTQHKNLIIPRWLFTDECHREIAYKPCILSENMLWDKNLVGRRLRKTLTENTLIVRITFKDCFTILKDELLATKTYNIISNNDINMLLSEYMKQIKKQETKARMGQYIAAIKHAKTVFYKRKAIEKLLQNGSYLNTQCNLPRWIEIYENAIDYKTLLFISTFVPNIPPLQPKGKLSDYTESYIRDNIDAITDYVIHN